MSVALFSGCAFFEFQIKDFASKGPVLPSLHQPGSHRILTHIVPFLLVRLLASQDTIKEIFCQCGDAIPSKRNAFDSVFFNDFIQAM